MNFIGTDGTVENYNDKIITTWFGNLVQAPQLVNNNVSVVFGEQLRDTLDFTLPLAVLYLGEMRFSDNLIDRNFVNSDPFNEFIWGVKQHVTAEIWNQSNNPNPSFVDDTDAAILALSYVMQALYWQLPVGLKFKLLSARFATNSQYQFTRLGQSIRLELEITLPISYTPPDFQQVDSSDITVNIDIEPDADDPADDAE